MAATVTAPATGTVYGLVDPRDDKVKYVGQTVRPLLVRLGGHYSGKTSPRVKAWIAELRDDGLRPLIIPLREGVDASGLLAAERAEITRIMGTGDVLLNENATADGHDLLRRRREQDRVSAWADLADVAVSVIGGPVAPGELPAVEIPETTWRFMQKVTPEYRAYLRAPRAGDYRLWAALCHEQETAAEDLWDRVRQAWGHVRGIADDRFGADLKSNCSLAAATPFPTREDASRFISLSAWHLVAVDPWRHLAELGGLALDDASFAEWCGRESATRAALGWLAGHGVGMLTKLAATRSGWGEGPGPLLGAVSAAYSATLPPKIIRPYICGALERAARDHMLTQPMADLLMKLDPKALDSTFGKDISSDLDRSLGLTPGTSGRVLRALADRLGPTAGPALQNAADRSAQNLDVVALPDYRNYSGRGVVGARAISGALVRSGFAVPVGMSTEDYLAAVRALWVPEFP